MRQLSTTHLPPAPPALFHKLAVETVEQIFISACPSVNLPSCRSKVRLPDFMNSEILDPLVLSTVCRRWYNITKTCHSLWKTIDIWIFQIRPMAWSKWGFLQLRDCLNKSGNRPLTIRIHEVGDIAYDSPEEVSEILKLVMLHSERWNRVEFNFALVYEFLEDLGFLKGRFPRLESLKIHFYRYDLDRINPAIKGGVFRNAPLLTRICLGRTTHLMSVLQIIPWTQFSQVVFDMCSFEHLGALAETLKGLSTSVTTLKLNRIEIPPFSGPEESITLVKLRQLDVLNVYPRMRTLHALICPSLERLEIGYTNEGEVTRFLDDSLCSLKHLHLYCSDLYRYERKHCAVLQNPALSTLKSLSIEDLTDPVLDLLVFDSHQLFPSLETLRVDLKISWNEYDSDFLRITTGLQKIVKSRTQAKQSKSATPIDASQSTQSHNHVRATALKTYSFTFRLQSREDEASTSEDEESTSEDWGSTSEEESTNENEGSTSEEDSTSEEEGTSKEESTSKDKSSTGEHECLWNMEPLERLRLFCLSGNIHGQQ